MPGWGEERSGLEIHYFAFVDHLENLELFLLTLVRELLQAP